jgi:NADP-dependent 3-hydroxy acid dehydrogenase YdfG
MDDRVFLITGATSGIGAATARLAAQAGFKLVLAARSADKLERLAKETGGLAVRTDVSYWPDVEALASAALDAHGRIDVVFANAGVGHPRGFEAGDPEDARQMVLTNVFGVYATIRATARALREARGHLLITSSVAGRRALKGSLYSATKFAATGMSEAARQDFNGTGVRVTVIEPGMVETPGFSHPIDEVLAPDDIARAVLYAVSQPAHVDINEILVRPTAQDS